MLSVTNVSMTLAPGAGSRPAHPRPSGTATPASAAITQIEKHGGASSPASAHAVVQRERHQSDERAPRQAIERATVSSFRASCPCGSRRVDRAPSRGSQRDCLIPGVAADARHDWHQRRQRHELRDGLLEHADHARRDEGRAQIECQPRPAIAHRHGTGANRSSAPRRPARARASLIRRRRADSRPSRRSSADRSVFRGRPRRGRRPGRSARTPWPRVRDGSLRRE